MEKPQTASVCSSFHEKVESNNECLFWPSSPNERMIHESRKSNPTDMSNISNVDHDLSVQIEDKNDSIVNASMYDSFAIDESKYDSFEDSLDENAQARNSPKKINAAEFLSEQVNVTLRKVREKQKFKGSYLCDSLEDICSLVSNVDHFSSSDELENINNILEKHGICEDSLRNDICCNRNTSLNDQNFDDDSLAILEAEKHFEDSLDDPDVASCVDSLMILGSSVGDIDVTVDKIGTDHCGMKTSVQIIYENAPLSSDESYRTAENFISERNSPSLSERPLSRDSLEEIHDISEMVSEMSLNVPLKNDANSAQVEDLENTSIPNSFHEHFKSSHIVRSTELHSVADNRFSNAESERTSSVVNSCYFYDTFCIDESIDMPLERTTSTNKCDFDENKSPSELLSGNKLLENHGKKTTGAGSKIDYAEDIKNTFNNDAAETHLECKGNLADNFLSENNINIENISKKITESEDLVDVKSPISKVNSEDLKDELIKMSFSSEDIEKINDKPENSKMADSNYEHIQVMKLENTNKAAEESSTDLYSPDSPNEEKDFSWVISSSDNHMSKNITAEPAPKERPGFSIVKEDKLNLKLQIELAINNNRDVNIMSISSADQKSNSVIQLPQKSINPEDKNVSKIEVFNQKAHQLKNPYATFKTDELDKVLLEAQKKIPTLPLSFKDSINNYCCKSKVSQNENLNVNLSVNFQLLKALDLHDSFYDFSEKCRVQSRDSIMPLNLCIRDEQFNEKNAELFEGKENIPSSFRSPDKNQETYKLRHQKGTILNSGNKNLPANKDKKTGKTALVTKIPVRKVESAFAVPVLQKPNKLDIRTSPCCGKPKKIPLVKSTSIDSIGKTTLETPKKHHFCTVRNSICRVPKSKEKPNPKKFQNIQSPVAMYIGNLHSPLKPTHRFDGNQISSPSRTKGKSPTDANVLLSPTVKKY